MDRSRQHPDRVPRRPGLPRDRREPRREHLPFSHPTTSSSARAHPRNPMTKHGATRDQCHLRQLGQALTGALTTSFLAHRSTGFGNTLGRAVVRHHRPRARHAHDRAIHGPLAHGHTPRRVRPVATQALQLRARIHCDFTADFGKRCSTRRSLALEVHTRSSRASRSARARAAAERRGRGPRARLLPRHPARRTRSQGG